MAERLGRRRDRKEGRVIKRRLFINPVHPHEETVIAYIVLFHKLLTILITI